MQQATRAKRPLPGLLPTCAHSSYEEPVRGKARGPEKSDSSSRDRTAQLAGAERPQDQQALACHPCQAQAAGCPGLGRVTLGERAPIASARELCHRSPGWRLGMNSARADAVTF